MLDHLNPKRIFDSARNVEIMRWRLNNKRLANHELMLLSNSYDPADLNTSFDRIVHRIIDFQDLSAEMMGGDSSWLVESSVRKLATAMFIPL